MLCGILKSLPGLRPELCAAYKLLRGENNEASCKACCTGNGDKGDGTFSRDEM